MKNDSQFTIYGLRVLLLSTINYALFTAAYAQYPIRTYLTFSDSTTNPYKIARFFTNNDSTNEYLFRDLSTPVGKFHNISLRVRDYGTQSQATFAGLRAVSKGEDSTYTFVNANANGSFQVGGRRPQGGSPAPDWIYASYDSTVLSIQGNRRVKLAGTTGLVHFPVGKNDTLAVLGDVGGGWTVGASKLYTKNAGTPVHIRDAAGDTTGSALLNVYDDVYIDGDLTLTSGKKILLVAAGGDGFLQAGSLTNLRQWTLPDATGTVALTSDIGIKTLNALSSASQSFATGTSGTDFGISSSGSTHTFNIPSASSTARGLVTTGAQTFAGEKTFGDGLNISTNSFGFSDGTVTASSGFGLNWTFPSISGTVTVGTSTVNIGSVNSVSPTSPNRTITITIGGSTYYIHAKTTND